MSKTIVVRLKKAGSKTTSFTIKDSAGTVLATDIPKKDLIKGLTFSVEDSTIFITLIPTNKGCCTSSFINIPITQISKEELVKTKYSTKINSSVWKHGTDITTYNKYYGCGYPYIIEYPFFFTYHDEILQSVKDFTKAFVYLPAVSGNFDTTRKIQTDDDYFNKSIIYNDQQSTGLLTLVPKPKNNMKEYMKYPIYSTDSKTILFTKSDNFYQYNTFWNVIKDKTQPIFNGSCESLSIDKELNQDNMDYSSRLFKKQPIRGKDVKIRHILDDSSTTHLVSQFIVTDSQISYK